MTTRMTMANGSRPDRWKNVEYAAFAIAVLTCVGVASAGVGRLLPTPTYQTMLSVLDDLKQGRLVIDPTYPWHPLFDHRGGAW